MDNEYVLSCPFCGSKNLHIPPHTGDRQCGLKVYVACEESECLCTGPEDYSLKKAIAKWNTRLQTI